MRLFLLRTLNVTHIYAFAYFSHIGEETRLARVAAQRDQPTRQPSKLRASEVETIHSLADVQAVLGQLFNGVDVSRENNIHADGNTDNACSVDPSPAVIVNHDDVSVDESASSDIFSDDTSSTDTVGWSLIMIMLNIIVLCKLTALQINFRRGKCTLKCSCIVARALLF